jgi:dihydroflavonol-4-reductase
MRALVTGSTGFVGANLVEGLISAGHQVRAMHRPSSRLDALAGLVYEHAIGDVLDPVALRSAMADVDWVFHVAAVSDYWRQSGTAWLYRVNVGGTRNVLQAAMEMGVRRVVLTSSAASLGVPERRNLASAFSDPAASSDQENGRQPEPISGLLSESSAFNLSPTQWPYAHSKFLAERVVAEYVDRGLDALIVNPTAVLGPKDLNLISGSLIIAVCRRQLPAIPPGGANYVDVADVVAGHIAAAERGQTGERYILSGHNLTQEEATTIISQKAGVSPPRFRLPRFLIGPLAMGVDLFNQVWPGEPMVAGDQVRLTRYTMFYDGSKAKQELGLGSPIPFSESVECTIQWYRDNGYL